MNVAFGFILPESEPGSNIRVVGPYEKIMRVMDYISGMTDRYAVTLFRKLQGITI
ncbi:MAG: hypothetical protein ABID63_08600 [Pseudomonadota bacterium]